MFEEHMAHYSALTDEEILEDMGHVYAETLGIAAASERPPTEDEAKQMRRGLGQSVWSTILAAARKNVCADQSSWKAKIHSSAAENAVATLLSGYLVEIFGSKATALEPMVAAGVVLLLRIGIDELCR